MKSSTRTVGIAHIYIHILLVLIKLSQIICDKANWTMDRWGDSKLDINKIPPIFAGQLKVILHESCLLHAWFTRSDHSLPWASCDSVVIHWQSSVPGAWSPVYTGMPLEKVFGSQCVCSVLPVVFQCVPMMQITTGLPLGHRWVQTSHNMFHWHPSVLVALVVPS